MTRGEPDAARVARPVRRAGRRNPPIARWTGRSGPTPTPSWPGPNAAIYYELFVIIDIYSRYVVAWTVAEAETGELAEAFIADALDRQQHRPRPAHLARRPRVVDDLQACRPAPRRSRRHPLPQPAVGVERQPLLRSPVQDPQVLPGVPRPGSGRSPTPARSASAFFDHYNHVHRHAGIGLHTPASVHYGTATEIRAHRAATLTAAYNANPARFRHRPPTPPKLPTVAWINEPNQEALIQSA